MSQSLSLTLLLMVSLLAVTMMCGVVNAQFGHHWQPLEGVDDIFDCYHSILVDEIVTYWDHSTQRCMYYAGYF